MEMTKRNLSFDLVSRFSEIIFFKMLSKLEKGTLKLTTPYGEIKKIGKGEGPNVDLQINNPNLYKSFLKYGDIGIAESYIRGEWNTSNLCELLRWAIQNIEELGIISGGGGSSLCTNLLNAINRIIHLRKENTLSGSKDNISFHYDLSNEFYKKMLDPSMAYSSGDFSKTDDLATAQIHKFQNICDSLDIKEGDHILEIGCGWGSLTSFIAENYDCKITAITISKEQFDFTKKLLEQKKIDHKVTLLFEDYRKLDGAFDKIVSIEMIEAVGHKYLPIYFQTINKLLKNDGVAVIQAITSPDSRYDQIRKGVDYIQKHIFPGSLLPSIRSMTEACSKTELHIFSLKDMGLSYAKTLRAWKNNVDQFKNDLNMNDGFYRKWNYYLEYCEAAFKERNISVVQIVFIKPNNTSYKYD